MLLSAIGRGIGILLISALATSAAAQSSRAAKSASRSKAQPPRSAKAKPTSSPSCNQCGGAQVAKGKKGQAKRLPKTSKAVACQPKGYVDPKVSKKFNAALRDMRRAGIKPVITSTWRSSEHQAQLHKCSRSRRCRIAHPGLYYALPPGSSLHEAGFAVDISGVARGPRGAKKVTAQGQRIITIMRKYGFMWRYGLADPAHFEADPTKHGYKSVKQAINKNQTQCSLKAAPRAKKAVASKTASGKLAPSRRQAAAPAKAQARKKAQA